MGFLEINWTSAAMLMLFVLMVYFLNKFLYTPFIEMAEKRKKKVESDLKSAEELKKEAEKMKEEAEKQLLEARQRADEIVESARREAETIVEDAREKAKKEAQSIIDSAKAQIEVEYKEPWSRSRNVLRNFPWLWPPNCFRGFSRMKGQRGNTSSKFSKRR